MSLITPARLRRSGEAYLNRFNLALVYASFSNIIPSTILTYHAFRTGMILETVLISLALGQHVRLLNRKYMEKRKKQNKYMRLASHDSLTNLYNTRAFWQIMEHNLKEAEILEQPLSLAIFDLDHFKRINDRYGHQTGDIVLRSFAEILSRNVRGKDAACRYGGEEFCLIMPASNSQHALKLAQRIKDLVEQDIVQSHIPSESITYTVSIGIAESLQGCSPQALFEATDSALYQAKATGRNRIVIADPFSSNSQWVTLNLVDHLNN